ncbi:unnamed protein product [Diatraea saccharalis]|uniref:FP protein C-terminal domain-containing protein n=1 Tax=Diatraea saccharalis TaxID=40085 RepID=A0A9N9R5X4_9NEOP|nr:unnamed protein product [Diatraea saccharalis]
MSNLLTSDVCAGCNKPPPKGEFMRCTSCKAVYDLECINMSTQRFYSFYKLDKKRRNEWKCPACQCNKPKNDNQNTPVRTALSPDQTQNVTHRVKSTSAVLTDTSIISLEDKIESGDRSGVQHAVELKNFFEEMRAVRLEMSLFRSAISEQTDSIKSQNLRLDALENRVIELENRPIENENCTLTNLEDKIAHLRLEIEERDQQQLGNDIVITNFPEAVNENVTHVILAIAKKLGLMLDERDVVAAWRMGVRKVGDSDMQGARTRPIAVRLVRRVSRDALLRAARVRRSLTVDDVTVSGATSSSAPRPFYINERLTAHNKLLFQRVREVARRHDWRYVWTREGKIFARQETGKGRHHLRTEADLSRVFGFETVGDANKLSEISEK